MPLLKHNPNNLHERTEGNDNQPPHGASTLEQKALVKLLIKVLFHRRQRTRIMLAQYYAIRSNSRANQCQCETAK
jgi:hypothetical protein